MEVLQSKNSTISQAIELLNDIKRRYEKQLNTLGNLKKEVTNCFNLEQKSKSKLRIEIESMLIDLNEELFSISEELASAYQSNQSDKGQDILQKARTFQIQQKRFNLKIDQILIQNPLVQIIKDELQNQSQNTDQNQNWMKQLTVMNDDKDDKIQKLIDKLNYSNKSQSNQSKFVSKSPQNQNQKDLMLTKQLTDKIMKFEHKKKNQQSIETFGNKYQYKNKEMLQSESNQMNKYCSIKNKQNKLKISQILNDDKISQINSIENSVQNTQRQKRISPCLPLRNRNDSSFESNHKNSKLKYLQSIQNIGSNDKRSNDRSLSIQQLNSKNLLNKIYTIDTNKKSKFQSNSVKKFMPVQDQKQINKCNIKKLKSNLIPKFRGCGPGGANSSLMAKSISESARSSNNQNIKIELNNYNQNFNEQNLQKTQFYYQKVDSNIKDYKKTNDENILHANSIEHHKNKRENSAEQIRRMLDIKYNNHNLKNARIITTKLLNESPQSQRFRSSSLLRNQSSKRNIFLKDSYDLYPQKLKQENETIQISHTQNQIENGFNFDHNNKEDDFSILKSINPFKTENIRQNDDKKLTEVSPAIVSFSKDFDLMRAQFGQMSKEIHEYKDIIQELRNEIKTIKNENICLNSDIHSLRIEHSQVLNQVHKLDMINNDLVKENIKLKDILYSQNFKNREKDAQKQNMMTQYSPIRIKQKQDNPILLKENMNLNYMHSQQMQQKVLHSNKQSNLTASNRVPNKIDFSDKENLDENKLSTNRVLSQLNQDFEQNLYPSYVIQKHRTENAHQDGPDLFRQNSQNLPEKIHQSQLSNKKIEQKRKESYLSEMNNLKRESDIKSQKNQIEQKRMNEIDSIYKKSTPIYSVPITVKSQESNNNCSVNDPEIQNQQLNKIQSNNEDESNQQLSDWVIERIKYKNNHSVLHRRFQV